MTQKWIEQKIKEAHKNAIEKGFYDCPECKGTGQYYQKSPDCKSCWVCFEYYDKKIETCVIPSTCDDCKGTGINPNKNIGELLMLIVSELGEALEAHRKGAFANWAKYEERLKKGLLSKPHWSQCVFDGEIKDTFEDEIADVFIRLFDLCGYLRIDISDIILVPQTHQYKGNIGDFFFLFVIKQLYTIYDIPNTTKIFQPDSFRYTFEILLGLCETLGIDIIKHIEAKMEYNKIRPRLHGKEY